MHAREGMLVRIERELSVRLPRALFAPELEGPLGPPVEPEALLTPGAGLVQGGRMLPDALPFVRFASGDALLLRFGPTGQPLEVVAWRGDGGWHPSDAAPGFPSAPARALAEARRALRSGLARVADAVGRTALAGDLGVSLETFAGWLQDARLVPDERRAALRRLTGEDDATLFTQRWDEAAAAARRAALRGDLAWPGVVLGWVAEGAADAAGAGDAYAGALLADAPTLEPGFLPARPGEPSVRMLAEAWRRCAGAARPEDPALAAALEGPRAVRTHHLAECDRLRAAGHPGAAYRAAWRAGWRRPLPADMDDVLGRLGDAAEATGAVAHAALARLHLRAWTSRG
ncbi:MAG: hypothetical protein QM767_25525 [Anaeromyxobacter sp.]